MICQRCNKNVSSVHLTRIVNGKRRNCISVRIVQEAGHLSFPEITFDFTNFERHLKSGRGDIRGLFSGGPVQPLWYELSGFHENALLGCSNCYIEFEQAGAKPEEDSGQYSTQRQGT